MTNAYRCIKNELDIGDILLSLYRNESFVKLEKSKGLINSLLGLHTDHRSLIKSCLDANIFNLEDIEPFFYYCLEKKHFIYLDIVKHMEKKGWDYFLHYFNVTTDDIFKNPEGEIATQLLSKTINAFLNHATGNGVEFLVKHKTLCGDLFESIKRFPQLTLKSYFSDIVQRAIKIDTLHDEIDLLILTELLTPLDLIKITSENSVSDDNANILEYLIKKLG